MPVKQYSSRVLLERRRYCLHIQVWEPDPTPLEHRDIQRPQDILGADRGSKNHAVFSNGARAHNPCSGKQRKNATSTSAMSLASRKAANAVTSQSHSIANEHAATPRPATMNCAGKSVKFCWRSNPNW